MTQSFTPEDVYLERVVSGLDVSAENQVVCSVKGADREKDEYFSCLWLISPVGEEPRQLTWGSSLDSGPRWSPDASQIAYLSNRNQGSSQVYLLPCNGGEPRQLTSLARGASDTRWSPTGDRLLVIGNVTVDPNQRHEGCVRDDGAKAKAPDPDSPKLCWRLPYKLNGTGYILDTRSHLFVVDVNDGQTTQITSGDYEVRSAAWSPDGKKICISRTREKPNEYHCTDIWVLDVENDNVRRAERMSFDQANSSSPSWSPDGRWIVFTGSLNSGDPQCRLWLIDLETKEVKGLGSESLEVVPGDLCWTRSGNSVGFIQAREGVQSAALISVPEGQCKVIAKGNRHLDSLALGDGFVYTAEDPASPQEVYYKAIGGEQEQKISSFNAWWNERDKLAVMYRSFCTPDGDGGTEDIDGWVLQLQGGIERKRKTKGPLLVDFHGGPASYVDLRFSAHSYWQILACAGWTILSANTVGSCSYGRKFSDRLRGKWGELDLPQHLAIVKQLQIEGVVGDSIAVSGTSYGGFMAAYSIGKCEWISAAVVCAPVGNIESHFGTSDGGYYSDTYSIDAKKIEFHQLAYRLSPTFLMDNVRAPTLFIQGMEDERCPKSQTEELYVKLACAGNVKTEMVLYPGADHSFSVSGRPSHRVDALQRICEWLESCIENRS